jgi:hypothetical protein
MDWGKPRNTSVRITGDPGEIRTEYLPTINTRTLSSGQSILMGDSMNFLQEQWKCKHSKPEQPTKRQEPSVIPSRSFAFLPSQHVGPDDGELGRHIFCYRFRQHNSCINWTNLHCCNLQHVSAIYGHHQVSHFTFTLYFLCYFLLLHWPI